MLQYRYYYNIFIGTGQGFYKKNMPVNVKNSYFFYFLKLSFTKKQRFAFDSYYPR